RQRHEKIGLVLEHGCSAFRRQPADRNGFDRGCLARCGSADPGTTGYSRRHLGEDGRKGTGRVASGSPVRDLIAEFRRTHARIVAAIRTFSCWLALAGFHQKWHFRAATVAVAAQRQLRLLLTFRAATVAVAVAV